jgi:hypothetical protein
MRVPARLGSERAGIHRNAAAPETGRQVVRTRPNDTSGELSVDSHGAEDGVSLSVDLV